MAEGCCGEMCARQPKADIPACLNSWADFDRVLALTLMRRGGNCIVCRQIEELLEGLPSLPVGRSRCDFGS
jgi:hypothetical protein